MNRSLRKRHVKYWVVIGLILLPIILLAYLNIPG